MPNAKKDLVDIIKANPGCVAIVDNDTWTLYSKHPTELDWDREKLKQNELASDSDVLPRGDGYGSGNCYGGDLLQALAVIVGITVESV